MTTTAEMHDRIEVLDAQVDTLLDELKSIGGAEKGRARERIGEVPVGTVRRIENALDAANGERAELETALTLLRERAEDVRRAEYEKRLDAAVVEHRAAVVEVAKAAVNLAKATKAEAAVRDPFQRGGVVPNARLVAMTIPGMLGSFDADSPNSNLAIYLRDCVRSGYLAGNEDWLRGVRWEYK